MSRIIIQDIWKVASNDTSEARKKAIKNLKSKQDFTAK